QEVARLGPERIAAHGAPGRPDGFGPGLPLHEYERQGLVVEGKIRVFFHQAAAVRFRQIEVAPGRGDLSGPRQRLFPVGRPRRAGPTRPDHTNPSTASLVNTPYSNPEPTPRGREVVDKPAPGAYDLQVGP